MKRIINKLADKINKLKRKSNNLESKKDAYSALWAFPNSKITPFDANWNDNISDYNKSIIEISWKSYTLLGEPDPFSYHKAIIEGFIPLDVKTLVKLGVSEWIGNAIINNISPRFPNLQKLTLFHEKEREYLTYGGQMLCYRYKQDNKVQTLPNSLVYTELLTGNSGIDNAFLPDINSTHYDNGHPRSTIKITPLIESRKESLKEGQPIREIVDGCTGKTIESFNLDFSKIPVFDCQDGELILKSNIDSLTKRKSLCKSNEDLMSKELEQEDKKKKTKRKNLKKIRVKRKKMSSKSKKK